MLFIYYVFYLFICLFTNVYLHLQITSRLQPGKGDGTVVLSFIYIIFLHLILNYFQLI